MDVVSNRTAVFLSEVEIQIYGSGGKCVPIFIDWTQLGPLVVVWGWESFSFLTVTFP